MRFREELVLNIQAPREAVWAALQDFSSWPTWAKAIKEVSRVGSAWRFKARGQPPVDLVWVAEATERRPPEFLAFRSVPGVPHNLEISGWLRLDELPDGTTHLELLLKVTLTTTPLSWTRLPTGTPPYLASQTSSSR